MLNITGGNSSNHLYLNGEDFTFQGKDNAIKIIAEHYNEIDKFIDDSYFKITNEETNTNQSVITDDIDDMDLDNFDLEE